VSGSRSDTQLGPRIVAIEDAVARTIEADAVGEVGAEELRRLVSAAVRLYAAACEREGVELMPVTGDISTTEAVRLSVALARSQNLSPFDLALWFRQVTPETAR